MRIPAIIATPILLAACAGNGGGAEPVAPPASAGTCNADNTAEFVGQKATAALGAAIQARTGASIFQWVGPDQAVTMDYRPERVRVTYDMGFVIERITCG
ncbi:I78 family peptidase inhibitor [Erythrobacter sp. HKB08]|uniref:I78 family peptidase inhibitor n=1 Tax=Erythrobacter sp. HKB08 TaxID=2502843 RepID=UPI001008BFA1|nr:I78 family peptidase inhibitor [Erythrobacter sp. HKB08]